MIAALGAFFALLYLLGASRLVRPRHRWRRAAAFASSVVLVELVLNPPVDGWADRSLAAHMLQHVVLMSIVPPLVVLAAPWVPIWRGLPLAVRRPLAHGVVRLPAVVRRGLRGCATPVPAFMLVTADLGLWHVPALYDLTLRNQAVHDLEHVTFLVFGILFWLPVLDSPPLRRQLDELRAAGYLTLGAAAGWVLGVVLALASGPLYPAYAALPRRLGGISALADQQAAAGIMIGVGAIPPSIAVFVLLYRWLDDGRPAGRRLRGEPAGFLDGR
jgi:cytochrome c oxidase assembly factor CtaG